MTAYYYKNNNTHYKRFFVRLCGLVLIVLGGSIFFYVSFPLLSWNIYFVPVFASSDLTIPIPKTTIVSKNLLGSLVQNASTIIDGTDYQDARTWFPSYQNQNSKAPKTPQYFLSIPKLGITNAVVSTTDYDLDRHLVHYGGTSMPPDVGNAVIFGHSTLPQLFNPNNYKTIFANAYKLQVGDTITVKIENILYTYKIASILVVDPSDTSIFSQNFDGSYLTLVTCTPPGTTWKRLILRAQLEKL